MLNKQVLLLKSAANLQATDPFVDGKTEKVLGAHMVGEYAAEVIQMMAPAMKAGVTKPHFDAAIGIHSSLAEEFFTLTS